MVKVLIVEDDPMVAMINEQYIRRCRGFEVVGHCRDGKSALAFLDENAVDLIILDVYMPTMDGFHTLRQIRQGQNRAAVDAIMVTAANDRESLEEALRLGVVDYLVKPFAFERFKMALDKFTAQREALGGKEMLDQQSIDFIIDGTRREPRWRREPRKQEELRPKGIQEKTLQMLLEHLCRAHGGPEAKWLTGDAIAAETGLTGVTVRRYMNYLAEIGEVESEMNYETGGRPSMMYRAKELYGLNRG